MAVQRSKLALGTACGKRHEARAQWQEANGKWLFLARQTAVKVQLSIIHKIAHTSALITYTPCLPLALIFLRFLRELELLSFRWLVLI